MASPRDFFATLSAELRNRIYQELFFSEASPAHTRTNPPGNTFAIFATSRMLHAEASSYFYSARRFRVNFSTSAASSANILPPIADHYVRFLKYLNIDLQTGCASHPSIQATARKVEALANVGVQFEEITLVIGSAADLCPVLNRRLDDSILDLNHPITIAIGRLLKASVSKAIQIQLHNAWFATGVAVNLQSTFSPHLKFVSSKDSSTSLHPSQLEQALRGNCSMLSILSCHDDVNNFSELPSIPTLSNISLNSFIGIDPDEDVPSLIDEMDAEFSGDEEVLSSDDDVDLDEDLLLIDNEEAEKIAEAWSSSVEVHKMNAANAAAIEFMTHMAPEWL